MTEIDGTSGAFLDSLTRTGKQIKKARAEEIMDGAYVNYKRCIEDIEMEIKSKKRQLANMLDMSPTTVTSLKLAEDFDASTFVSDDLKISVDIRNLTIKLEIAKERFTYLFGKGE